MTVIIDTTFLVDLARGNSRADRLLRELHASGETFLIPTVAAAEYLAGSTAPEMALEQLRAAGELVDFSQGDALAAAAHAREAFRRGDFPAWVDAMIAGVARSRGDLSVVTANPRHFPGLRTRGY